MTDEQMFAFITKTLLSRYSAEAIVHWLTTPNLWLDDNTPAWEIEHGDPAHVYTLLQFIESGGS